MAGVAVGEERTWIGSLAGFAEMRVSPTGRFIAGIEIVACLVAAVAAQVLIPFD